MEVISGRSYQNGHPYVKNFETVVKIVACATAKMIGEISPDERSHI